MASLIYLAIGLILAIPLGRGFRAQLPDKAATRGSRNTYPYREYQNFWDKTRTFEITLVGIGLGLIWPFAAAFGAIYLGITKGGK